MSNDAHQSQCAGWAVSRSGCTTFVEVEVGTAARMNSSPHSAATHAAWVARVVRKPPVCCAFAGALIAGPPHVLPPTRCSFTGTITPGRAMWRRRKTWRPCRCAQVVLCHPRFSMWLCNLGCAACGFEAPRTRQLCRSTVTARYVTTMWACKCGRVAEPWGPPAVLRFPGSDRLNSCFHSRAPSSQAKANVQHVGATSCTSALC